VNIHSATGELVKKLDLGYKTAGAYADKNKAAHWDGKNEAGENVGSGVYFCVIKVGEFQAVRKMYLVK
jgi:flagellar hook assembly protein FlgD